MREDPVVNRAKYDREVARLQEQQATLQRRGMFLVQPSTFPIVDVIYVPRHPLQIAVPAPQNSALVLPAGTMALVEVPNLAARAFKARFDLSDYDLRAPSVEFRDPWTNTLLEYPTMFRALEYEKDRKAHLVLLDEHPSTHRPFLCLRGIREYHEHPQHSGDDWLLYRRTINLFSIVMSVWRVTIDLVHAQLVPQPNGIQTLWVAEEKL